MLFNELIGIAKKNIKNKFQIGLLIISIILLACGWSSIMLVLFAGIVGGANFWRMKK